ncbi:MAG: hypothetical protein QW613_03865 [Thermoprotei archaeon]
MLLGFYKKNQEIMQTVEKDIRTHCADLALKTAYPNNVFVNG